MIEFTSDFFLSVIFTLESNVSSVIILSGLVGKSVIWLVMLAYGVL